MEIASSPADVVVDVVVDEVVDVVIDSAPDGRYAASMGSVASLYGIPGMSCIPDTQGVQPRKSLRCFST